MKGWKNDNDPWVPLPHHSSISCNSSSNSKLTSSSFEEGAESSRISEPPRNPLHDIIDSERYIQTLERKLDKLKKKKENPSSKDIINSLALFHEDQMRNYVNSVSSTRLDTNDTDISVTTSYMKRKLFPEMQAINATEIAELVREDFVEKSFEELSLNVDSNLEIDKHENDIVHVSDIDKNAELNIDKNSES